MKDKLWGNWDRFLPAGWPSCHLSNSNTLNGAHNSNSNHRISPIKPHPFFINQLWHWKFQTPPQNCSFSAMLLLQYLVLI